MNDALFNQSGTKQSSHGTNRVFCERIGLIPLHFNNFSCLPSNNKHRAILFISKRPFVSSRGHVVAFGDCQTEARPVSGFGVLAGAKSGAGPQQNFSPQLITPGASSPRRPKSPHRCYQPLTGRAPSQLTSILHAVDDDRNSIASTPNLTPVKDPKWRRS